MTKPKTRAVGESQPPSSYDANGNVLTVTDSHGTITRTYDALNRVESYTDTYGKVIRYEYDEVGNLSKLTYPDNTAVNYRYDENHNLIRVIDWANRVTAYTYDVNNRVIGVTKPDGSVTTTVYDNMQRVTSTVERTATGTVITGFEYIYDDLSRIVEEKHLAENTKLCYTYDNLSRVTKRTVKCLGSNTVLSEENFTYDAAGNITDAPDSCFQYDTNNRLVVFNGHAVSYDLDGNMLNNGEQSFTYDSANRLITADGHTYTYNAEDVRIRNLCTEEDTTYTYNTNAKLSMLLMKTTDGVVTKYVFGKGLIGEAVGSTFKTYHFDSRGSTIAITDASGSITDTFAYDTYGKMIDHCGNNTVIFGYNGRDGVVTDDNGLIYMRARYYSPDMKRFVNADIIAGAISNAVTLNRYAYANGNPVSFVDPFGLSVDEDRGASNTNDTSFLDKYGAIYVVDYGEYGLPFVGHSLLYIKDENGVWYKTEFTGNTKKDAKVYTNKISKENIKKKLDQKPVMGYTYKTTYVSNHGIMTPTLIKEELGYVDGVQFYAIEGDFSQSVVLANDYKGSDYGGYCLTANNCLDYVQEILQEGLAERKELERFINNTDLMIPKNYYDAISWYGYVKGEIMYI